MSIQVKTHSIISGDRRTPIAAILQQKDEDGEYSAVDLSGASVAFRMVDDGGATIIDDAAATVVVAADGSVSYSLTAGDMTAMQASAYNRFWGWFIVTSGGNTDPFPVTDRGARSRGFKIEMRTAG